VFRAELGSVPWEGEESLAKSLGPLTGGMAQLADYLRTVEAQAVVSAPFVLYRYW
jgi:hypothetical protein